LVVVYKTILQLSHYHYRDNKTSFYGHWFGFERTNKIGT